MLQEVYQTITQFVGQNNMIVTPRVFAQLTGDLNKAVFLNQLLYWQDKMKGEWLYKTYKTWEEEIQISEYQVRKATKYFKELGFLETKVKKAEGNPTLHYKFDYLKFSEWFIKNLSLEDEESEKPYIKTINKDYILSKDNKGDSSESPKPQNKNSSKLEDDSKKESTSKKKNDIIEYWNSKKESCPRITFHKSPDTKTYQNAVKYISLLKNGSFYTYISLSDEMKAKIPKNYIRKKWNNEEIKNAIDKLCLLFVDGYWPENKDKMPKSLPELMFNPRTGTSWFFNVVLNEPQLLWEESETLNTKALESYTKFYNGQIDSTKKEARLNKLVNGLIREQKKIYDKVGERYLDTGFRSKFGYMECPDRFVIQHLAYLKRYPNKTLTLLRTDNGVWDGFVRWFKDFHGYDLDPVEDVKSKRIKSDGPIKSADDLLDNYC